MGGKSVRIAQRDGYGVGQRAQPRSLTPPHRRDLLRAYRRRIAAFTLRPLDSAGQPTVPMEGNQFYLAAVVGVTGAQEEVFRRLPMGGDGLLAPIFRYGLPVRVGDITSLLSATHSTGSPRQQAEAYAHGRVGAQELLRVVCRRVTPR